MAGQPAADVFVGGVFQRATHVARCGCNDPWSITEGFVDSPETPRGKIDDFFVLAGLSVNGSVESYRGNETATAEKVSQVCHGLIQTLNTPRRDRRRK
ncbi:Uncharacterised protein [Chlamydia trachomatis]|nr:Uncharacterised protein [Chlamydia trachomatis]